MTQFRTSYTRSGRSQIGRSNIKNHAWLAISCIIIGIILYFWSTVANIGNIPVLPGTYTITKGTTLQTLPDTLKLNISDSKYKFWLKFFAPELNLKAGTYVISDKVTLEEAFSEELTKAANNDLTLTILPGWNIYDIDAAMAAKWVFRAGDVIEAAEFALNDLKKEFPFLKDAKSVEGFLYPDTYRFPVTMTAETFIKRLLKEFDTRVGKTYTSLGENAYNRAILASILEREERAKDNQPKVAGILLKRLDEWIALGADATACYAYKKTQKECTPSFIGRVINESNEYNTRNKRGLPPTPISNFSETTWQAALNPDNSPYYYYLHDNDGNIHYGKTLEEHIENKKKYLQ